MNLFERIAAWLDVRPNEVRTVTLSFLGAFLVMAFLVLARALREALYLDLFDAKTLPYVTGAVAVLSVPTVGLFGRALTRYPPKKVLGFLMLVMAIGLAALWPLANAQLETLTRATVVAFYIWTALGTLILTSGFWVVTSEYFPVRGAKRLFGLIGAGGTAGAMVMGTLLIWLSRNVDLAWLPPGLIVVIALFYATQRLLPKLESTTRAESSDGRSLPFVDSMATVWRSRHLRMIATIVFTVGIATALLDYQFKELAQDSLATREQLTSFFGAFYGWTGGVALLIQLLLASRFLAFAGLGWTLAVLPAVLLLGSTGLLVIPSLVLVTAVRGADASLRKSLYRFALEVIYTPVPSALRRKTKGFIDSVVDSVAEGFGAAIVFLWVTLPGLPSRFLSVFVILCSAALLFMSRRMGQLYFATVTEQLQDSGDRAEVPDAARLEAGDLLSGTFTRLDISTLVRDSGPILVTEPEELRSERGRASASSLEMTLANIRSQDVGTVARTLRETSDFSEELLPDLARLLARDVLLDEVIVVLTRSGDPAVQYLSALLVDESTDFVIRRRIPRVLARAGGTEADDALLDALSANRFEIRYRSAIALMRRRSADLPASERDVDTLVWEAIRLEAGRGQPVWEMQKLLDGEPDEDDLVSKRIGVRGELSLEHTFRLLGLVLETEVVRAAFHGIILDDEKLKNFSLEYLEQTLPTDIRKRLWPFIGDISEYKQKRSMRSLDEVVSDLMTTGATLFADAEDREALRQILHEQESEDD